MVIKIAIQTTYEGETYTFKINEINWSKYIDNIDLIDINLEKRRLAHVYSSYKELEGDGMKFAIKLVDDSTKTLEAADAFLGHIAKICDRKCIIFMQYGTEWLIYKFNITKQDFEKFTKTGSIQNFHKFIYDEILYPNPTKLLAAFFIIERELEKQLLVEYQENIKLS